MAKTRKYKGDKKKSEKTGRNIIRCANDSVIRAVWEYLWQPCAPSLQTEREQ